MIGCLRLAALPISTLQPLRLRLDQLSPRVQLLTAPSHHDLLLDLGLGTSADGRGHATVMLQAAGGLRISAQVGIAPTPTLARLAARQADREPALVISPQKVRVMLARCPIEWLEEFAPHAPTLHGLGLRSLAAVAALPAGAVLGRFGNSALRAWRALHGDEPPLAPVPSPPRLRARRPFDGLVTDRAVLALTLGRLTTRLAATLERRGVQARALALHLHGDAGLHSAGRVLEHPAATAAALTPIALRLLEQAGADGGAEAVELIVGELVPLRGEQLELFGPAPGRQDARREALDDLAARLGPTSLLRGDVAPAGISVSETRNRLSSWSPA
jgi:DNA polymerase-4